jgi:hypothetical protein
MPENVRGCPIRHDDLNNAAQLRLAQQGATWRNNKKFGAPAVAR